MKSLLVFAILFAAAAHGSSILYSSNFGNNTVTAYDVSTGVLLGTPVAAGAELSGLNGVRIDPSGNFVIAGQTSNNLVRYTPAGVVLSVIDPGNAAGLNSPQDLAFGPDGKLYVVSSANDRIIRYDESTGAFLDVFANLGESGHIGPIGLAFGPDTNLYVTAFDNAGIVQINGTTGEILHSTPGPPGIGFGPATFGPDGDLYVVALNLSTFAGSVYRYVPATHALSVLIPEGAGGLQSAGGVAFSPSGALLAASVVFDPFSFEDTGSSILRFDVTTGALDGTLVAAGASGLDIPFFLTVATPVPEPGSASLISIGLLATAALGRRRTSGESSGFYLPE